MTGLLRSEFLKLRTVQSTAGLTAALIGLVCLIVAVHGLAFPATNASFEGEMHVFGWGELGVLFAALFGALSITSDLRSGMIRPTFLATPDRRRVLIAKLVVSAVGGAALGLLAEGLALGLGSALLAARGMPVRLEGSDYAQLLIGGVLAGALWGPLGLGLGALFRNQVATLIGLCAWLLFVENVLLGQMPEIIRYFPDAVSSAIAGATVTGEVPSNPPLLAPITGAFVLTAYTIAANLAGMVAMVRRDIP